MKIIAFLDQKGGCGKTTISSNVASCLHHEGEKVLLVDMDPQGSATDWAEENESPNALPVIRMGKNITRDIRRIGSKFDWVIIDGAPQTSDLTACAVKAADVVLIPCQPSPYDAWSAKDTVDMVKTRQEITDGLLKSAFIISRQIINTNIGKDVKDVLTGYDLPIMKHGTTQRVAYPTTASTGGSVMDLPDDHPAKYEIRHIVKEIREKYA